SVECSAVASPDGASALRKLGSRPRCRLQSEKNQSRNFLRSSYTTRPTPSCIRYRCEQCAHSLRRPRCNGRRTCFPESNLPILEQRSADSSASPHRASCLLGRFGTTCSGGHRAGSNRKI